MTRLVRALMALSLALGLLGTPIAMFASRSPQTREREVSDRQRVYDRDHKDYHLWNESEDRAYHRYWQAKHRTYRDFSRLNRREQSNYWTWRHSHPDHDRGN